MNLIEKCVNELNEWALKRPYSENIKTDVFESKASFSFKMQSFDIKELKKIGEIHCYIAKLTECIEDFNKDVFDYTQEEKIFEHIDSMLKFYKVNSISLGENLYKLNKKNNKYKLVGGINRNIDI